MTIRHDTCPPLEQSRRCWPLLLAVVALCWAAPRGRAEAQVLCPAATYAEHALGVELSAALELRRGNTSSLWSHEGLCGRLEMGKHWSSLRIGHAFGRATLPASDAEPLTRDIVQVVRALPQYRYLLTWLGTESALRLELVAQYQRDPGRRIDHRIDVGLGPQLSVLEDDRRRLGFTLAYYGEAQASRLPPGSADEADPWRQSHGLWLGAELGWDVNPHMFVGGELIGQLPVERCPCAPRASVQTTLRVRGNEWLALESTLLVLLDARPVATVEHWDAILRTGLVFSL